MFEQLKQFIELPIQANYAIDAKNTRFIESELKTFKALYKEKIISFELYLIVEIYSIIKFIRRIIISKFRR